MAFTADDARDVADELLAAAEAIDAFLDEHGASLGEPEYDALSESAKKLLRECGAVTTQAVGLSIDQLQDDAAEVKQVIIDAKDSLAKLESVGSAIQIAAGLVDLAMAIVGKDAGGAGKAVKGLYASIKDLRA